MPVKEQATPAEASVSRIRDQLSMVPDADDPYEIYRQRILQAQAEQAERNRQAMPPLPAQQLSQDTLDRLRQRNYHYDPQQYYARSIESEPPQTAPEPFFRVDLMNRGVALAAIVAVAAGCVLGLALTKRAEIGQTATQTLASIGAMLPADQPPKIPVGNSAPPSTVIPKKPISTASLDVQDVTGNLNSSILLPLKTDPAYADQDISIRISGLPQEAVLTAGQKVADQTWVLSNEDLDNVRLVVPHADAPVFDLSVAAIDTSTGELASPVREMKLALKNVPAAPASQPAAIPAVVSNQSVVKQSPTPAAAPASETVTAATSVAQPQPDVLITPVNAPPPTASTQAPKPLELSVANPVPQPVPSPVAVAEPSAIVKGMLEKGDVLLKSGDLVMAREFYQRAFELGAPQAALGLGKSYDPEVFKELKVEGLTPDAAQARDWYRKASAAGVSEAAEALARLDTTAALSQ